MQWLTNWRRTQTPMRDRRFRRSPRTVDTSGHTAKLPPAKGSPVATHQGEAEAIALATDIKADIVLMDEQDARKFASETGLAVTGVLGILLRAKRDGHIAKIKPEIDFPRTKARFFVAESLETKVLSAAGE